MPLRAQAAGLLALLLLSPMVLHAAAQAPAGTGATPETPFEALPDPLRALTERWRQHEADAVEATRRRADEVVAQGLDRNLADQVLAVQRARYLGAWDFLNESRLGLGLSQLAQVRTEASLLEFLARAPPLGDNDTQADETQRRAVALAMLGDLGNQSRAALDAFEARLRRDEAGLRSTAGFELALLAASIAVQGESLLATAKQFGDQVNGSAVVDDRILRFALGVEGGPVAYAAWATDVLELGLQRDAAPGAAPLPAGVKAAVRDNVTLRLDNGTRSSTTGLHSSRAKTDADAVQNDSSVAFLVARYVAFQEARSADALDFLQERGQATAEQLREALRHGLTDVGLGATYDGRFHERPAWGPRLATAGYEGIYLLDARNHGWYEVVWEPAGGPTTYGNLLGAWAQMVGAEETDELLTEAAATPARAPQDTMQWLLLGGVAVLVALAVLAVAMLRRPSGP